MISRVEYNVVEMVKIGGSSCRSPPLTGVLGVFENVFHQETNPVMMLLQSSECGEVFPKRINDCVVRVNSKTREESVNVVKRETESIHSRDATLGRTREHGQA